MLPVHFLSKQVEIVEHAPVWREHENKFSKSYDKGCSNHLHLPPWNPNHLKTIAILFPLSTQPPFLPSSIHPATPPTYEPPPPTPLSRHVTTSSPIPKPYHASPRVICTNRINRLHLLGKSAVFGPYCLILPFDTCRHSMFNPCHKWTSSKLILTWTHVALGDLLLICNRLIDSILSG